MKRNILKAALIVASISSLNAGYLETALSHLKSGFNKSSSLIRTYAPKAQKMAISGLTEAEEAIDKTYEKAIKQSQILKNQAQTQAINFAQNTVQKTKTAGKYVTSNEFKLKVHNAGLLVCIAGTSIAAIYEALFARN